MRSRGVRREVVLVARVVVVLLALTPLAISAPPAAVAAPLPPKPGSVDAPVWHLRNSLSTGQTTLRFNYGRNGDIPLVGDWDGNGSATPGVIRRAPDGLRFLWLLRNVNNGGAADIAFVYGRPANFDTPSEYDVPIVGDWDGNGTDTPGVVRFRSQQPTFMLRNSNSSGPANWSFRYGRFGHPVVGDWDGNGTDTPGIARDDQRDPGQLFWFLRNSNTAGPAHISFVYGNGSDVPISGDWDGDGKDTPGAVRNSPIPARRWLLRNSNTSGLADRMFEYGINDRPVVVWR